MKITPAHCATTARISKTLRRGAMVFLLIAAALNGIQAQYLETFSTANKGYLLNMQDDFTGVGWTLTYWDKQPPNVVGRDSFDYFQTTAGGVLESIDLDEEVCWFSPVMNIAAAGTVSLSVGLVWTGFDVDAAAGLCEGDYIKVMYSVNGGPYTMVANQFGGNACGTVAYPNNLVGPFNASGTVTQGGITGNTLRIRVCVFTNANAEVVQIDNVSVPQAGVTTGCSAPSVSTTTTQAGSCNSANGSITVTANGATPGYNVAWSGPTSGNPGGTEIASAGGSYAITPLGPGTYTITVTDAASCSATTTAAVTTAAALSLSTQVLNTSCSGSNDGEINLGVSNGVPPYTYSWSNLPGSPDPQDQTDLIAGTYTVTVTDNAGCSATISATVGTASSGAYLETFSTPNRGYLANFVDDFAGVNWSMSNWDNQPPNAFGRDNNDYFQTTAGGLLEAFDLDQEVCWLSPVLNIAGSGAVTFNVPVTWNQFDNEDYINIGYSLNGAAFVTIPNAIGGGAGTIQYPFPTVDQSGSTTITKTGLTGSTLQIRACASSNSNAETIQFDNIGVPQTVSLCLCPTITFTATPTATCSGSSNGQIAVTGVTGGTGPYMYSKDNGANYQAGATFTGLAANTYQVVVKDANNCTSGATAVVVGTNLFTSGTVFTESMGTAPSTTTIAAHETANGYDNDGFTMSGTGDMRNTTSSSGYTGASGLANVFLTTGGTVNFQIANINTSTYPAGSLSLSFGLFKSTTTSNGSELSVQVSSDGTNYTPLTFTALATGSGTATWFGVTTTGTIPSTANLRVRFTNTSASTTQFRVDDVALSWTLPSASITPGGPTTFCSGGSVNLTASNGSSWLWSTTATTQSITASTAGAYSVVITAPNGCTASAGPTTVTVNSPPACSVAGANSVCANSTGNTFSAPGGMSAYSWSVSGNGTAVGATNTSTVTVTAGASGTFTVNVTVTAANGCTSTCNKTVTINAPPTCSVAGANSVCAGTIGNVFSGTAAMSAYSWSVTGNGTAVGSTTGSAVTVTAGAAGTFTVNVTITNANGCTSTCNKVVTVNANPACSISGATSVCANSTGNTYSAPAGMSAYSWAVTGNGTIVGAANTSTVTVTAGAAGLYTMNVTVTNSSGCTSVCVQQVTVNPNPACSIAGANSVCANSTGNVYSATAGMSAYSWGISGSGSIVGSTTGSSITVTAGGSGTYTVSVTITAANGCTSTCSQLVTTIGLPDVTIIGPTSVCSGGSVMLDAGPGYSAYAWSGGGGSSQTATFSNIMAPTTYTVTVTSNGCTGTDSHTVTIGAPTPTITGPTSVCSGGSVMLDAGPGYSAYAWSGGGGSSQTATFSNITTPMTYTVTVSNNGCTGTDSHTVTVNSLPGCSVSGADFVCSNSPGNVYSAPGGMSAYSWGISPNGTITSATNGSSVTVTAGNYLQTYTVTVTITDANGCTSSCSKTSDIFLLTPPANITINPNPACFGVTLNLSITAAASSTVSWSGEGIGNPSGNPSTTALPTTTGPHTYGVTVTTDQGCSNTGTASVTVNPLPMVTCPGNSGPICSSVAPYALTGGSPGGGVYSGPGVSAGIFNPATAGAGMHTITYTVTDGNGCTSSCMFTIEVTSCNIDFSGQIKFSNNTALGVKDALVSLTGSATGSNLTDVNGNFSISTGLTSGSFTLKPAKTINKLNGVTAADANAVQQHVANSVLITDLYKQVAADVNKSNSITTTDASVITQALLGNASALAQFSTSWRFVPTSHTMTVPPWGFPEQRTYTAITSGQANQDFFGIKTGDVVTTYANPANFAGGNALVLTAKDQALVEGNTLDVHVAAEQVDAVAALQMAFGFDPAQLQLLAVEPEPSGFPLTASNIGMYNASEGETRVVWTQLQNLAVTQGTPMLVMRFKALQNGAKLSEVLYLDESVLQARMYNLAFEEFGVELRIEESTGTNDPDKGNFHLLANRPNPFTGSTTIGFVLPQACDAQLRVLDVNGRELLRIDGSYAAGHNSEVLHLEGATASGVLYCELVTPFGVATRKMTMLR